jgi:hypothetical protein
MSETPDAADRRTAPKARAQGRQGQGLGQRQVGLVDEGSLPGPSRAGRLPRPGKKVIERYRDERERPA